MNFDHPEFRANPDGTGSLRGNQFNWFQYSAALGYSGNTAANYSYATVRGSHGTHVAGTIAGANDGKGITLINRQAGRLLAKLETLLPDED